MIPSEKTMLFPVVTALSASSVGMTGCVAVVMRTKDRPLLLHRALSSVLCQTYQNWHLYLVNDGGDRATLEDLLAVYRPALRKRLTLIHHPISQGMEKASDAALALAKEEFAVVHDDDDSWHPEFLEATTNFLSTPQNRNFVGVWTDCVIVKERIVDGHVETICHEPWVWSHGLVNFAQMLQNTQFPPICMLFRRAAIDKIGPFNGALPVLGDWEFNMRLMMLGDIDFIDRKLAFYHHREATGGSIYGNSVVDGSARHSRYRTLLGNSVLRAALLQQPAALGIVQALLWQCNREETPRQDLEILQRLEDMTRQFAEFSFQMDETRLAASWIHKLLRPVHWLWRMAYPFRRVIAKIRGRA